MEKHNAPEPLWSEGGVFGELADVYLISAERYVSANGRVNSMRPCPKRDSNPHAVTGMYLSDTRVYQFRHSGTSTRTTVRAFATLTRRFSLPPRRA